MAGQNDKDERIIQYLWYLAVICIVYVIFMLLTWRYPQ